MEREAPPLGARRVAGAARLAHVAVETAGGPHVTPQGFAWVGDDVWLVAARGSLKVRAIRRRPRVGVLLRAGDEAVVLSGVAEIPWPGEPGFARAAASMIAALPCAGLLYGAHNAALLAGYTVDLAGLSAPLPIDRVPIRVRVLRGALLDGEDVLATWGRWTGKPEADTAATVRHRGDGRLLDEVPEAAAVLARARRDGVLALQSAVGPLPLPARWDARTRRATVAADAVAALKVPARAAAALEFDEPSARPSRVAGIMLRGSATLGRARARRVAATVDADRATWWLGFDAGTTRAGEAASPAA
jgi:Pyridoxamine 5'-phosphate oxidase